MKSIAFILVLLPSFCVSFAPGIFAQSTSCASTTTTSLSQSSSDRSTSTAPMMKWFQHEITVTAPSRGCHLITSQVQKAIANDISQIKIGMVNLFVQHTSASLTINENADPDVRRDMEVALSKMVPAEWNRDGTFRHTMEGDDDMPVSTECLHDDLAGCLLTSCYPIGSCQVDTMWSFFEYPYPKWTHGIGNVARNLFEW